jgi:hypothetical protein
MNAKQRRRLVRQYKEKIHLDMAIIRLEGGKERWFDPKHPSNEMFISDTVPWRYYRYALYMKDKEST